MTPLERYIAGWRAHDVAAILATLTPDCIVIESFGPIYRGHDRVAEWVPTWLAQDGRVIDWTIHSLRSSLNDETAEWTFHYTWRGVEKSFDGATIAKLRDGKLVYLREYTTTSELYEWHGKWKSIPSCYRISVISIVILLKIAGEKILFKAVFCRKADRKGLTSQGSTFWSARMILATGRRFGRTKLTH